MNRSDVLQLFPALRQRGFDITSPFDPKYNCIAFAAGDETRWWWPVVFGSLPLGGFYWPPGIPLAATVENFILAYESVGYEVCQNAVLEPGYEKVAIFGNPDGSATHAARQLPSGVWTSKLGRSEDIEHRAVDGVSGTSYGEVAALLHRSLRTAVRP